MILLALAMLAVLASSVAAEDINVYVQLDKVQYEPGGQGTISITIRNTSDDPLEIKNVSIEFTNWMMYTVDGWDELGNQTIVYASAIQVSSKTGKAALDDISFSVPTDGRATSTSVHVWIYTNKPSPLHEQEFVSVVDPSTQNLFRALDNIVMLLTVTAILAIVSAIIIAAAVFLSARRPGVTWQKEE